jgi:hypothetical protein
MGSKNLGKVSNINMLEKMRESLESFGNGPGPGDYLTMTRGSFDMNDASNTLNSAASIHTTESIGK